MLLWLKDCPTLADAERRFLDFSKDKVTSWNHTVGVPPAQDTNPLIRHGDFTLRNLPEHGNGDNARPDSRVVEWRKAAKAVFKKYPGGEMRNPDYSDKAMARARDPELFTGDASKFDSWITAFSDKI
ncbi:hypothetical protein E4U26_001665 [Claviceps purpurea]|nr:hypothetical protein E4U26_001665 [Claviceps purpurea]